MKTRFGIAVAVALLGFAVPASADTLATFVLDDVAFSDDGTATGGFTLDLTKGTLSNVNITTSIDFIPPFSSFGTTYNNSSSNTFTNGATAQFEFDNLYYYLPIPFPTGEDSLIIDLSGPLTATNLTGSPTFAASGSETDYFFLCSEDGFCGSRTITGGSLDVTSLEVTSTPLPAALPLFAGGLGMLGVFARRRKRKAEGAISAA